MNVLVVESPAKAKTINKYLGSGYKVLASFGHIRDLPSKDGSVKPDDDFAMSWEVDANSQSRIKDIADALKGADKLILATDPDREGEAISWHVLEVLKQKKALGSIPVERVVFNAVTKSSILEAIANPRAINEELVDAYLARRALDYLVGFTLSPVLWRKLTCARSAGRVQSVALRLVVEREIEIEAFRAQEYWSIDADVTAPAGSFSTHLTHLDGKKVDRLGITSEAEATPRRRPDQRTEISDRLGREQAGQAQPCPAVHHLDLAAGGVAQAGLRRQAHDADRAAPLRRHGCRRRNGGPHYLYAHRRRADGRRSDRRSPPHHRQQVRPDLRSERAARLYQQGEERAGSA